MANRIITKALAGIQDLIMGRQTVTQARYSGNVDVDGLYSDNIPYDLAAGESIRTKIGKKAEVVSNIAALQAIDTDTAEELYVYVMGYTTSTDGGGGLFWLDTSDTSSAEDLKYIFNPDNVANGRWKRVDPRDQLTADNGDANVTLTAASNRNQFFGTNFTANRTVALPTTGLYKGKQFRVIRTNTSAYTLTLINISPSVVLAASESATVEVIWDGAAWQHVSKTVQVANTTDQITPYYPAKLYFAHEASIPAMSIVVDAGQLVYNGILVTNVAQTLGIAAADPSNARIDRVTISPVTGVCTVTTGTPSGSPATPAIPAGRLPICQMLIPALDTAVTNSQITDERFILNNTFIDLTVTSTATVNSLIATNINGVVARSLVLLDTPVTIVNSATITTWTLMDMSVAYAAAATAGAKAAIIHITSTTGIASATTVSSQVYCRKTGSGAVVGDETQKLSHREQSITAGALSTSGDNEVIVALNANSDFDWYHNDNSGNLTINTRILLVGYYV